MIADRSLPIRARRHDVPIVALERWRDVGDALEKRYLFMYPDGRDGFITELLAYERRVQHNARLVIDEGTVDVRLQTRDLNGISGLDREYARYADVVYRDIVASAATKPGAMDGDECDDGFR